MKIAHTNFYFSVRVSVMIKKYRAVGLLLFLGLTTSNTYSFFEEYSFQNTNEIFASISQMGTIMKLNVALAEENIKDLSKVNLNWVTEGQTDKNDHIFTVSVPEANPEDYYAFWQLEDGAYVRIYPQSGYGETSTVGFINFASWYWKGNGPYKLSFIIQDRTGKETVRQSLNVYRHNVESNTVMGARDYKPQAEPLPVATTVQPAAPISQPSTLSQNDPLASALFNAPSQASAAANEWKSKDASIASKLALIGDQPQAIWLTSGNQSDVDLVKRTMESAKGKIPQFVLYGIPNRDCGSHSRGGVDSSNAYRTWVENIANAIGDKHAMVILEPDAITLADCLSATEKAERFAMLKNALTTLNNKSEAKTYIDAGHPQWLSVNEVATRLKQAGVADAAGFALNVSNFISTEENIRYGTEVSAQIGSGSHFVVDTSRNGPSKNAYRGEWCNPLDRSLGKNPTLVTYTPLVDGYLWIKHPGESDGNCNGGPNAGQWWLEGALTYVKNTTENGI